MTKLVNILKSIEYTLKKVNMVIATAGGVAYFLFMCMIVADVTGRYAFLAPVAGTTEVGQNVLAFSVFMSWGAVLATNQHIRVYMLLDHLAPRKRVWFELLASIVGFAVILPIAWYSLTFSINSFILKETGFTYGIPQYPGKLALFIGTSLFALQFFIQFLIHLFSIPSSQTLIPKDTAPNVDV
jgi:TRAP-type C4-dicarboxylate transport system permease small subunit